jgi:hypothetical protein
MLRDTDAVFAAGIARLRGWHCSPSRLASLAFAIGIAFEPDVPFVAGIAFMDTPTLSLGISAGL